MSGNMVLCPLTNTEIEEYDCYLICEATEGNIPQNEAPCINSVEEESRVCRECEYYNID